MHKETKRKRCQRKDGCSLPPYKRDQVLPQNSLPILSKTSNAPARSITCSNQTTETAPRCHNLLPNSSELFQTPKKLAQKLQNSPPNHSQAANVLLGTNLPKTPSPAQPKANQSRRIALGAATGVFLTQSRLPVCERAPISTKKGSQKRVPGPKNPEQGSIES